MMMRDDSRVQSEDESEIDVRIATRIDPDDGLARARVAAESLLDSRHSLVIASIDDSGEPLVSTYPFVREGEGFLIVVSGIAAHGASLARRGVVSVMFLEDEQQGRSAHQHYMCPRGPLAPSCTVC